MAATARPRLAEQLWTHPALVHPDALQTILPSLRDAADISRVDREAAWRLAAQEFGDVGEAAAGDRWAHIADATWSQASSAARHRLSETANVAGPFLGGVHASRMVSRTYNCPGPGDRPWQVVVDVATNAVAVVAWKAISAARVLLTAAPDAHQAWVAADQFAAAALQPVLADLDRDAYDAGLDWSAA